MVTRLDCWKTACAAAISLLLLAGFVSSCGGYREGLKPGQSFRLASPNYPSPYPRNQRCIWLFNASAGTGFLVNVTSVNLEGAGNNSSGCSDYLQITDGSSRANQLAYLCQVTDSIQFTAERLYLWIKFQSNHQLQLSGFELTVTTVQNRNAIGNSSLSSITVCNLTQYACPNKECVFHGSLCDNVNDCGCEDYGCDETKCWKFDTLNDLSVMWGIGTSVGITLAIVIFLSCGFLEMPERTRPECMRRQSAACLERCSRKNRVQQQTPEDAFMAMMKRMTGDKNIQWDEAQSESEASRSASRSVTPRTSISGPAEDSSPSASRRSSVYTLGGALPVYGNTLSPKDSLKVAAASAKTLQRSPGPKTLAVPRVDVA